MSEPPTAGAGAKPDSVLAAIVREFDRYEALGSGVLDQLSSDQLCLRPSESSNSVAQIVWHLSGNLQSRFTDFLDTDGEKTWRRREEEFARRNVSREEVLEKWRAGWSVLRAALASLEEYDLTRTVAIRGQELSVLAALLRSVTHLGYHVGQMAFTGKLILGDEWSYLSIPPGGTEAYNQNPTSEWGPPAGPDSR